LKKNKTPMTTNNKAVVKMTGDSPQTKQGAKVHPAWLALMRHCREIGFGEIERIKIQDGVPVMIETTIKRTKLT